MIADKSRFIAAHTGDTRVYFFRGGTLGFYSKDHSLARAAVERGEITAAEIRGHEDQNKLTRVLGSDGFSAPDYKICDDYANGDSILICTDGFWEYVYEYEMERVLQSTDGANPALRKMEEILRGRAHEGHDNYTAMLLRFTDPCPAKKTDKVGGGKQWLSTDRNVTFAFTVSERLTKIAFALPAEERRTTSPRSPTNSVGARCSTSVTLSIKRSAKADSA